MIDNIVTRDTCVKIPSFSYPGGKARMGKFIVSTFPQSGTCFIEPFAGRGNVFWQASQTLAFSRWILNDIRTFKFFQAIRDYGDVIVVPARTREEYYRQWEAYKNDCPFAIMLEPYLTFGGGGYGSGGFGNLKGAKAENYQKSLRTASSILRKLKTEISSTNITEFTWDEFDVNDFAYFDPPYFASDVRAYSSGDLNHEALAEKLSKAKFKWVLSEYETDFYNRILGQPFYRKTVQLSTTNLSKVQGQRIECLWKNF